MESEFLLLCLQEPTIITYHEPQESRPQLPTVSLRSIVILSSYLRLGPTEGISTLT
jgi:hypothetical protein